MFNMIYINFSPSIFSVKISRSLILETQPLKLRNTTPRHRLEFVSSDTTRPFILHVFHMQTSYKHSLLYQKSWARFIRGISVPSNTIQTIDNETAYLVIYCLNCNRRTEIRPTKQALQPQIL